MATHLRTGQHASHVPPIEPCDLGRFHLGQGLAGQRISASRSGSAVNGRGLFTTELLRKSCGNALDQALGFSSFPVSVNFSSPLIASKSNSGERAPALAKAAVNCCRASPKRIAALRSVFSVCNCVMSAPPAVVGGWTIVSASSVSGDDVCATSSFCCVIYVYVHVLLFLALSGLAEGE